MTNSTLSIDPTTGVDVALDAVERALKAGADAAKASHGYSERFEVNFDTHDVTLVRTTVGDTVSLTAYDDTRRGTAQITGRAHDAVDAAAAQAVAAARAGERDEANILPAEGVELAPSDPEREPDRDEMVDAVLRHIERTRDEYPTLRQESSTYSFVCSWSTSYANSFGRTQQARFSRYVTSIMVSGKDDTRATSFNATSHVGTEPFADLTDLAPVRRLFDNTVASFDARAMPATFVGDVIFTPEALRTWVGSVAGALGGMALMRNATPFADSIGEPIAVPEFSLLHRPREVAAASPFDGEGFLNPDLDVIRDGVLQDFFINWYFSHKLGRAMTTAQHDFIVPPGGQSLDELIAGTKQGILLGRFSGGAPNQNLDFSGVAKNSFYVENGEVVHPLSETMIAGNFAAALKAIRGISSETIDLGSSRFPWVATTGITVSTK